jgi:hypothetical protein
MFSANAYAVRWSAPRKELTMIWAKTPAAASSVFCAVCIATAAVLPALPPAADRLAQTMSADVSLKVNWGALANFSAVPAYQLAAAGDPTAIFALTSLSGIPAYILFGLNGNVSAFTQSDTQAGLAALSGLETLQTAAASGDPADLSGIAAFSGIPSLQAIANGDRTGYYGLDSTNGLQAIDKWSASGYTDLSAFEPTKTNAGYAALSGANTWAKANASGNVADLAGIDAFSAIPSLQVLGNPASTQAQIWAAQRSLASVSAIPEYQDAPVPPADPPPPPPPTLTLATVTTPEVVAADTTPADNKPSGSRSNGSYAGTFTPKPVYLFGSGGGKNAADNGISGWAEGLKAVEDGVRGALGGAPAPSAPSGGAPSADAGGATP